MSATLKTATLGCKVNQYETQLVREGLLGAGYSDAASSDSADLCIINTCTVTAEGDSKSRQVIRRMHRENPDARIVVMGCYATRAPDEIRQLPGVAEIVTDKREIPDLLGRFGVIDVPTGINGISDRHRAYVKIQDGCLLNCSYCIIPKVRPQMYSRNPEEVLTEIRGLVDGGFREVVLTGIHLGHYGVDFNRGKPKPDWVRLSKLVRSICNLSGNFRIRLSSIEATEVTRELNEVMAEFPEKVCPHLHVCLQSGSDEILRRMKRRWSVRQIVDRCNSVKQALNRPAMTTDLIVGFPGESDQHFEESLDACRKIGFSKIHMFPFSARKGTPAADMPNQVPKAVKSERGKLVSDLETKLRTQYFESLLGSSETVLIEKMDDHGCFGTSSRYAPVQIPVDTSMSGGQLVPVHLHEMRNGKLIGGSPTNRA